MPTPADYRLRVTAGTSYDAATHVPVSVNDATPLVLHGPGADVALNVRIRGGRLHAADATTAANTAYFDAEPHKGNADTYSIGVWFMPRGRREDASSSAEAPAEVPSSPSPPGLAAHDLVWGNDFDAPIRQWLPPGFGTALRFVTWWVDPGLKGDPYGDRPFMYGPALSSFNRVYVGNATTTATPDDDNDDDAAGMDFPLHADRGLWFPEGGSAAGRAWRKKVGCPVSDDGDGGDKDTDGEDDSEDKAAVADARRKWALALRSNPDADDPTWTWEHGRGYGLDFYNNFLDFDALAVRLPGRGLPSFPLLRFWDGKTSVRYVLRRPPRSRQQGTDQADDRNEDKDDDVFLVVVFSLVPATEENGNSPAGGKEDDTTNSSAATAPTDDSPAISEDDVD